jgi:propanol-preferring alcohol dehydrogenase
LARKRKEDVISFSFTMKAARVFRPGVLRLVDDISDPEAKSNEVLVKISASGICHSDLDIIEGKLERARYRLTIGHESTGTVYKVGEKVDLKQISISEGQKVSIYPTFGCGVCEHCLAGRENLCSKAQAMGFEMDGSHAEYLLVKTPNHLFPIYNIDPKEAAPLSCASITVYEAIKEYVLPKVKPGAFVTVIGVGGLGHIAIQILKKMTDARVIAIDKDEAKLKLAEDLKADHVINSDDNNRNLVEEIKKLSSEKVCATLDLVGSDLTMKLGFDALGTRGILIVIGAMGGTLSYRGPDPKWREIVGPMIGSLSSMRKILEMAERREIKVLTQSYPLDQIELALEKLKHSEITGRAILIPYTLLFCCFELIVPLCTRYVIPMMPRQSRICLNFFIRGVPPSGYFRWSDFNRKSRLIHRPFKVRIACIGAIVSLYHSPSDVYPVFQFVSNNLGSPFNQNLG